MIENVKPTTETVGSIADDRRLLSGQANTRLYGDAEKAQVLRDRAEKNNIASSWGSNQLNNVISIGSPTPATKLPESED